jgi:hypothetical protein
LAENNWRVNVNKTVDMGKKLDLIDFTIKTRKPMFANANTGPRGLPMFFAKTIRCEDKHGLTMSNLDENTYIYNYLIIYLYIHTAIHIYMCNNIYTYTYIHACMHACIYIHIHTHTYTDIHTYILTYLHTYILTYILTYLLTYIYIYTLYLNMVQCMYICKQICATFGYNQDISLGYNCPIVEVPPFSNSALP